MPHCLVIEDDAAMASNFGKSLPADEFALVRTHGGRNAVALVNRIRPDAILLDLTRSADDGVELAQALLRNEDTAQIPIIAVVGAAVTQQERDALRDICGQRVRCIDEGDFGDDRFLDEIRRIRPVATA